MEKRKFDLFVHGNIVSDGYLASWSRPASIEPFVPYETVDTNHGIIVEGNMNVDNLYTMNKSIGCSGYASGFGSSYSDEFKSAKGKNQ